MSGLARLRLVRESHEIVFLALRRFSEDLVDGPAQILECVRFAQKRNVHLRGFVRRSEAARQKNWQSRTKLAQDMGQAQPVHGAGHRDVAEDEIEFFAAL